MSKTYSGNLRKMKVSLTDPVTYQLILGDDTVSMNDLIGQDIHFHYEGRINCKVCGRKTNKAFGEGMCYPCFRDAPENSPCIIRPELCEGHEGIGRDPEWEISNHVKPHVVYLALSSAVKVGVTRHDQVPTRWIDQGAWQAIRLAETPYRQLAGKIEVAMKNYLTDKTSWQKMLKNDVAEGVDLVAEKHKVREYFAEEYAAYYSDNDELFEINYPVLAYPEKVKSLYLDKVPDISGKLMGIKGQYLLLDENRVMNIRKHTGYWVEFQG